MLNIEKYKKEVIARLEICQMERMIHDITGFNYCGSGSDHCTPCAEYVYKWLLSEYKESILNDAEKKYLSAVIKPFRKKVMDVVKIQYSGGRQSIRIRICYGDCAELPFFKNNTMYKGMEVGKYYTPEELGLWNLLSIRGCSILWM